ncbi:PH domain-containing protein [Sanguibacter sp. HDW7]|uniref:PH domain-containing protein n=1 Tax=Sanguibacter sp. HDW7 TaxID=2714931 RepID=UPI00140B360F|nr:PH domain-containing protein [Sanguibacter sp. HDW7]QIK84145.1 hypothetical protein G7063_11335 [Sanguibacter sp. HDW7]
MTDGHRGEGRRVKGAVSVARAGATCILVFYVIVLVGDWPPEPWLVTVPAALSLVAFARSLVLEVRVSPDGIFVRSWLRTYRFAVDDIAYVGVGNYDGTWVRGGTTFGVWSVYVEVRGPGGRERVGLDVTMSGRRRAVRTVRELKAELALGTR